MVLLGIADSCLMKVVTSYSSRDSSNTVQYHHLKFAYADTVEIVAMGILMGPYRLDTRRYRLETDCTCLLASVLLSWRTVYMCISLVHWEYILEAQLLSHFTTISHPIVSNLQPGQEKGIWFSYKELAQVFVKMHYTFTLIMEVSTLVLPCFLTCFYMKSVGWLRLICIPRATISISVWR